MSVHACVWFITFLNFHAVSVFGFTKPFLRRPFLQKMSAQVSSSDLWKSVGELPSQDLYKSSDSLELPGGILVKNIAWRQSSDLVELWTPLSDEIRVKKEVKVDIAKTKIALCVNCGDDNLLDVDIRLLHPVNAVESSWFVETESVPEEGPERWLVVQLAKTGKYLNWQTIAADTASAGDDEPGSSSSLQIGLGVPDQRETLGQQLDIYHRIIVAMVGCS